MERNGMERNGMEQNENGTIQKEECERNNLAEGPRSRMEWNNFKKVGTCPALLGGQLPMKFVRQISLKFVRHLPLKFFKHLPLKFDFYKLVYCHYRRVRVFLE